MAAYRHWRATAKSGLNVLNFIVGNHRVFDVRHFAYRDVARNLSKRVLSYESVATIHLTIFAFFLLESKFDILPIINKKDVIDTVSNYFGRIGVFFATVAALLVLDFTASRVILTFRDHPSVLHLFGRGADFTKSGAPENEIGLLPEERTMHTLADMHGQLTAEDILGLMDEPKYKKIIAKRRQELAEWSSDVDPSDGGPTDEAILAELLAERFR